MVEVKGRYVLGFSVACVFFCVLAFWVVGLFSGFWGYLGCFLGE